ncbi:MAG: acyl--CoA ligase, partial [Gammaproteobacteria bacterium]|nr:acyl--CoA ligase [Gammaproteobacteria bacterium]
DKIAVIAEGQPYTYSQLLDSVCRLANALIDVGLERGDRCIIYMDNTFPCVVSIYATLLAGGVFVVINPQTKREKLQYILNDCSARILISDAHLYGNFSGIDREVETLAAIICSGDLDEIDEPSILAFDKSIFSRSPVAVKAGTITNDLAALIYTSGSTGNPKGVMHSHSTMLFALHSLIEYLRMCEDDRILVVLPLAFDYGLYQLLMSVQLGATLVLERSFTYPAQIFQVIENASVTAFPGVPTIFSMLISMHKRKSISFPSITRITNTAAALPPDYHALLKEIFPSALIYKMYGLTECKRVCYLEPEKLDEKPSSVGRAIPGTEVFILDENGKKVPPGETGMLYVRGPHIMLGYWNQDALSKEVLVDGALPGEKLLCTKDWFRMDADGDLYFQGRSDDIIKTRGEKVSPVEVENIVHGIEGVVETVVIGVEDEIFGEAVKCFVVLDEDSGISLKHIKKACVEKLENFMVPKYFELVDALPKTNTGKISKKGLK